MVTKMLFVVFIIGIGIAALIWVETGETKGNRSDKMEKLYATQEYAYIRNLLEDCTLVSKDILTVYFHIEQVECSEGFFHFSFQFQDLGKLAISSRKFALESVEPHIKKQCWAELSAQRDMNTERAVRMSMEKAYDIRMKIQKDADSDFFHRLFGGRRFKTREFAITSPFENYACSEGSCIVDTDCWKIEEDDAVFTGVLGFGSDFSNIVPYAIEETAKELFACASVSRYKTGCYISIH